MQSWKHNHACPLISLTQEQLIASGKTGSAQQVADMLGQLRFASQETQMGVKNVRLHLRILRRCSLAVKDQSAPKHEYSALYYFERNEASSPPSLTCRIFGMLQSACMSPCCGATT